MKGDKVGRGHRFCPCDACRGESGTDKRRCNKKRLVRAVRYLGKKILKNNQD